MPPPIFLDTLFVVGLVNRRDQYHRQAIELSEQLEGSSFLTTDVVLLEIGNALAKGYKQESIKIINEFLQSEDTEIIHLNPVLFQQAFKLYQTRHDKEWGFIDCVSFVVMKEKGILQALTFDKHFTQAGFQPLMREIP